MNTPFPQRRIRIRLEGHADPSPVMVFNSEERPPSPEIVTDGEIVLRRSTTVVIHPLVHGYWSLYLDSNLVPATLQIPRIREKGPHGWWHRVHGLTATPGRKAVGIRIGVIDEALEVQREGSCVRHVTNLGGLGWGHGSRDRAFTPQKDHALAICCLLAARPAQGAAGFEGVASGADVFFAAAGSDETEALDPTRLANAIESLAADQGCHLITISAGDCPRPTPEIEYAVRQAREVGTLCLFAAGNQGGRPLFPARYNTCLAVAACGQLGTAPEGTTLWAAEATASELGPDGLYLWSQSARGVEVELLAAGVGTFWCVDGAVAGVAVGTSYAAPVATGVLAEQLAQDDDYLRLPADESRVEAALNILRAHCRRGGFLDAASYGIPIA